MFGEIFNNPIVNPIGYMNKQLFGGGGGSGGSGSGATVFGSSTGVSKSPQPWTMNNTRQNGMNLTTVNMGFDSSGRPNAAPFESIRDSSGNLSNGFKLNGGSGINMDQTAYNKYLTEATSDGPSSWALAAMDQNNNATMNNLNKVGMAGASSAADAMSNLQMTGGMSGAQRERVSMNNGRDMLKARMDVLNNGQNNNLGIMTDDAKNKMNMLPQAYNMSMNNAKFLQDERAYNTDIEQYNLGNKLNDVSGFNNYNQNAYKEAMSGWAALKSSDAQAKAAAAQAKPGGILGGNIIPGLL